MSTLPARSRCSRATAAGHSGNVGAELMKLAPPRGAALACAAWPAGCSPTGAQQWCWRKAGSRGVAHGRSVTPLQADKEALAHIVYNLEGGEAGEVDAQMVEALRPSIEEAEPVGTQEMALDYIGKRGAQVGLLAGFGRPAPPACCTRRLGTSQPWRQRPRACWYPAALAADHTSACSR